MRYIKKSHTQLAGITLFFVLQSGEIIAAEQEKLISGAVGATQLWDSNFFRKPDDQELSEQTTILSAGVALATYVSRQQLSARWAVRSYQHAEYEQFDETVQNGLARWNGAWAGDFTSNLEWSRDAYLVDRWEVGADASDVVERDTTKFMVTKGRDNRFSFQLGASQSNQKHSNDVFTKFNFEDREGFVGLTYKTPSASTLTVRYRGGDRQYDDLSVLDPERDYNFDFDQLEIENVWKMSSKTTSTISFTRFKRDGVLNDSTGDYATVDFSWDATPKIQWRTGYSYKKPALGETIDLPSTIQAGFINFSWSFSPKWSISSRVEKIKRDYKNLGEEFPRTESQVNISPFVLTYTMSDSLNFKLDTSWRKNESPVLEREYETSQASLGLTFRF
ncbi:MAG: hypothetical protein EOO52_03110 [Gammaproteobacteria bacterium]|nr:MAG: hypothetical protein EOO52_03110 [Gammaproteobacteria bacterium]